MFHEWIAWFYNFCAIDTIFSGVSRTNARFSRIMWVIFRRDVRSEDFTEFDAGQVFLEHRERCREKFPHPKNSSDIWKLSGREEQGAESGNASLFQKSLEKLTISLFIIVNSSIFIRFSFLFRLRKLSFLSFFLLEIFFLYSEKLLCLSHFFTEFFFKIIKFHWNLFF